jgi:hypothetical protein
LRPAGLVHLARSAPTEAATLAPWLCRPFGSVRSSWKIRSSVPSPIWWPGSNVIDKIEHKRAAVG